MGSEMCIRDRVVIVVIVVGEEGAIEAVFAAFVIIIHVVIADLDWKVLSRLELMMDLQICVPTPPPPPATPPRARQLGAPPPPPATPPPPNLAQLELLATQDHLGQPSSKTHFTSSNLSTEINDSHFQCNTDALMKEPILNSVGIGFPSLAEHPPCSMPSSSNEAGRGRSSVRELSPRRLENPWRLQGDIDGADGVFEF